MEAVTEAEAVAVKVAVVEPAGTVTLAGTGSTPVLFELRVTKAPPVGAAALTVTVPVVEPPGATEVGLNDRVAIVSGATVTVALWEELLYEAVTETWVDAATEDEAVAVKVAVVRPAPISTVDGTASMLALPELRPTKTPPVGAAALTVMVPVVGAPEAIEVGLNDKLETATCTVTVAEPTL